MSKHVSFHRIWLRSVKQPNQQLWMLFQKTQDRSSRAKHHRIAGHRLTVRSHKGISIGFDFPVQASQFVNNGALDFVRRVWYRLKAMAAHHKCIDQIALDRL